MRDYSTYIPRNVNGGRPLVPLNDRPELKAIGASETFLDRFWKYVNKTDGCWIWTGSLNNKGYGIIFPRAGVNYILAHRASWVIHNGLIPDGKCVLHTCDNPPCVNPNHLWIGTKKDNTQDMLKKGRDGHGCLRAEDNPTAKLTWKDVRMIRSMKEASIHPYKVGKMFGVCGKHVALIVKNLVWKE